jgi:endonuclease/exonuclease/phosphatase family metal-dependent hydrolase
MTLNLYLGADLTRIGVAISEGTDVAAAASQTLAIALGPNNFARRVNAIVAEIDKAKPDLIGLQEVTLMTAGPVVVADFEATLLPLLPDYEKVIATPEGLFTVPGAGSLQTSNMILKRKRTDLVVTNAQFGVFVKQAAPFGGVPPQRNWQTVDVNLGGKRFVFVNTHLESEDNPVSTAQALEMIAGPLKTKERVIAVGDYNSDPRFPYSGAYKALTSNKQGKLRDLVKAGNTCCRAELLSMTESADPEALLNEHIDLVLASPPILLISGTRIGVDQVAGLYPCDHAGVVARLKLP